MAGCAQTASLMLILGIVASGAPAMAWQTRQNASYMSRGLMDLITESTILNRNATVLAKLAQAKGGTLWEVTVFIARPAGQAPILAGDVDTQLLGEHGPMLQVSRPSNSWVEAGGAAGTTASAVFRFAADAGAPRLLRILWAGEVAELKLLAPGPTGE